MTQPSRAEQLYNHLAQESTLDQQWATYKQALKQGRFFEQLAEQHRLEAENAYADVGDMKAEGRQRAQGEAERMLPKHQRAVDVRTNSFKAVGDAKGDFLLEMQLAATYANLAAMKYAKAMAIRPR